MKNRRIQILLIVVTVLALGAGLAAGFLTARLPVAPTTTISEPLDRTPLVEQLQLSDDQREQMRQIWEGVRGQVQGAFEDAQELQKQRDLALESLLTPDQREQFAAISKQYADRFTVLSQKRDKAFDDAVRQTKSLLNTSQQQKYDEILKAHVATTGSYKPDLGPTTRQDLGR